VSGLAFGGKEEVRGWGGGTPTSGSRPVAKKDFCRLPTENSTIARSISVDLFQQTGERGNDYFVN